MKVFPLRYDMGIRALFTTQQGTFHYTINNFDPSGFSHNTSEDRYIMQMGKNSKPEILVANMTKVYWTFNFFFK